MITRPAIATRIAAFFDIDGTLLPAPSLERRFFATLRRTRAIPRTNYLRWLARAAQLALSGLTNITHANKMYLRQVPSALFSGPSGPGSPACANVIHAQPALAHPSPTLIPSFLPDALSQAAWHASLGHAIVLVTGTLAPLAHRTAIALTLRLAARGIPASIAVCATRLQEIDGRCTGEISGEAMFGPAKARAIRRIAAEEGFDLPRCYAYADSSSDRWMLAAVGRPAVVNPAPDLKQVARLHDWPILYWQATPNPRRGALPTQLSHKRNLVQQQSSHVLSPEFQQTTLKSTSTAVPNPEHQS
jgi:phosphoserine phosphatase